VSAKADQISRKRRVGAYLRTTITTDPGTGKPVFAWHFDQAAISELTQRTVTSTWWNRRQAADLKDVKTLVRNKYMEDSPLIA